MQPSHQHFVSFHKNMVSCTEATAAARWCAERKRQMFAESFGTNQQSVVDTTTTEQHCDAPMQSARISFMVENSGTHSPQHLNGYNLSSVCEASVLNQRKRFSMESDPACAPCPVLHTAANAAALAAASPTSKHV